MNGNGKIIRKSPITGIDRANGVGGGSLDRHGIVGRLRACGHLFVDDRLQHDLRFGFAGNFGAIFVTHQDVFE